jgi:hypothetical protein
VTAGTIFDRSRVPLADWFTAIWFMTNQKYGVSALGLQRLLGLGSYRTAWTMLRKLRVAMVRPARDRLASLLKRWLCWERTRVRLQALIWMHTWTNLHSASTAGSRGGGECSFIVCWKMRS